MNKKKISTLHYLTQSVAGLTHVQLAERACKGGVDWVQLRVKDREIAALRDLAIEVKEVCKRYGAQLILNDHVVLAAELGLDGVHLGQEDMSLLEARKLLGESAIIGATAHTLEEMIAAAEQGSDYLGVGPYRHTSTKKNIKTLLGTEGYRERMEAFRAAGFTIPVIAIGGIKIEDVQLLAKTGIRGVAIAGAINLSPDQTVAAGAFAKACQLFTNTIQKQYEA